MYGGTRKRRAQEDLHVWGNTKEESIRRIYMYGEIGGKRGRDR